MCAIVSWNGNVNSAIVRAMIRAAAPYGPHSVGLAYVEADGAQMFKRAVSPKYFIRNHNHQVDRAARSTQGIVHTRYATHGLVIDQNAHPFVHEDRIFVHNGIISNYRDIKPDAIVDSECLGPLIVEQKLGRAHGSVGVTWLERTAQGSWTLAAYRHSQGLTSVALDTTQGSLAIVASRQNMIESILKVIDAEFEIINEPDMIGLDEGTAYEVEPSGLIKMWSNRVMQNEYFHARRSASGVYMGG